jgi:hypothetical protein
MAARWPAPGVRSPGSINLVGHSINSNHVRDPKNLEVNDAPNRLELIEMRGELRLRSLSLLAQCPNDRFVPLGECGLLSIRLRRKGSQVHTVVEVHEGGDHRVWISLLELGGQVGINFSRAKHPSAGQDRKQHHEWASLHESAPRNHMIALSEPAATREDDGLGIGQAAGERHMHCPKRPRVCPVRRHGFCGNPNEDAR